ncbi:multidrug ABC transporter permease/ATP-binding protein [Salipaludibacillus neizhouensis]|uniref:Multidrug ABC transporter permease/ATP-binding protein n=1 Tax=Salipaludibacillus neizhouensis TaxID=885475 RepID=A0A3A9KAA1_9BACI|nr:ABC transporter transmembrane domain-containing protein [Salipaludibacillus neizhouensis]RKL68498.1 multidrug ABC transporter permease/ATP-binding protein [Salipaludibacillus neizhouensis]
MFSVLKKLTWFFKQHKKRYILAISLLIFASLLEVIPPRLIGMVIDDVHQGQMTEWMLRNYIILFIGLMLVIYLITYTWMRQLFGGAIIIERTLRTNYMNHLMKMTPTFYEKNKTGDLMAKATNDLKAISLTTGFGVLTLIDATVFLVIILFTMGFLVSWKLTIAAFLPLPIMGWLMKRYGKVIHERFIKAQDAFGDLNDQVLESISGVRVVRAFVKEKDDRQQFGQITNEVLEKNIQVAKIDALFEPTIKILVAFSYVIGLGYGALFVFRSEITLGQLISFNIYLGMLIWPMFAFGELMNVMQRGNASMDRLNETFTYEPDVQNGEAAQSSIMPTSIELKDLSFSYPLAKTDVLKNIHIYIPRGYNVGIVGKTGSGKTTFFKQLLREYPIDSNKLFISQLSIEQIALGTLKNWIGYVPQDQFLFSKTIRENILFGFPDANEIDLERVMEHASITADIETFSDGIETLVGEKGVSLSGGQKQRIAIARALIKDPQILLLDDALSAVDAKTEATIVQNIRKERAGKTTFITAHRMSAVRHADLILVMEDGQVKEAGTHDELMLQKGWYENQFTKQQMENSSTEVHAR